MEGYINKCFLFVAWYLPVISNALLRDLYRFPSDVFQKCKQIDLPSTLITQLFVALLGGKKQLLIGHWCMQILSYSEFTVSLKTLDWDIQTGNSLHQIKNVIYLKLSVMPAFYWYLFSLLISLKCGIHWMQMQWGDLLLLEGENSCWTTLWIQIKPSSCRVNYHRFFALHLDCDSPFFFFPIAPLFCHWAWKHTCSAQWL